MPADADRAGVAEPDRQAMVAAASLSSAAVRPALGPRGAPRDVDVDRLHRPEIEHDPALGSAVTGAAVTAAADRELHAPLAGVDHDVGHVGRVGDPDDDRRMGVDSAEEDGASRVIVGIARGDHLPA